MAGRSPAEEIVARIEAVDADQLARVARRLMAGAADACRPRSARPPRHGSTSVAARLAA